MAASLGSIDPRPGGPMTLRRQTKPLRAASACCSTVGLRNALRDVPWTAPSLPRIRALLGRGSPSRFALPQPRNDETAPQLEAPLRGHSSATRPGACPCALRATPLRPYGNCLRDPPPNEPDVQLPLRKSGRTVKGSALKSGPWRKSSRFIVTSKALRIYRRTVAFIVT